MDHEIVVRVSVAPDGLGGPWVSIYKRCELLRQLQSQGWSEDALEHLNSQLDAQEAVQVSECVSLHLRTFAANGRSHSQGKKEAVP